MSLAARVMHVPAGLPIDESTRLELLDVGGANLSNVNVRQYRRGSLSKRLGFASLTRSRLDATSRAAGHRTLMHGDLPCTIDGTYLDAYSAARAVSVVRGRVPEASVSARPTSSYAADTTTTTLLDCCVVGSYVVFAHTTTDAASLGTGSLMLTVEDTAGAVLRAPELIFTADPIAFGEVHCVLASYSTFAIAIYFDHTTAVIAAKYLDTTSAATITTGWVTIGTIVTDKIVPGGPNVGLGALSAQSLTNRVAFAYVNDSAGASQLTVKTLTIAGVVETATVNTSSVTPSHVAVEGSIADTLWVAWNETTSVKIKGLDADVLATSLATTATLLTLGTTEPPSIGIVSSATAGFGRVIATDGAANRLHMRGFQTSGGAAAANGSQVTVPNAFLGSRPFRVGTRYYATFAPAPGNVNNTQKACVLCDFTDDQTWLRPVANIAPSLTTIAMKVHVESIGSSRYVVPVMIASSGAASSTVLLTLDFAARSRWQPATHNGATFLSGGLLSYFDGVRVAESGFVVRPPTPTTTNAGTGITGSFRYVVVYEEVDANGNWCISSISDPSDVETVTDDTITVTVRPCSITARQRRTGGGEVRIAIYRTDVSGEAPYYRLTTLPNDTSAIVSTYADATLDITANAQLYSPTLPGSGSAQDRRAPPFCQAVATVNGMLVVASGSDLWWSGQAVSGEGTWFNPAFAVPVEGHGAITALASQDGVLYVFKRRSVYSVTGEAPSDNGAQGGLGTPRRLAVDVGCIDPASVVVTSLGVFFQSERGIELLTRAGAVVWIGEKVQNTLASYPVVSSAVLDDRNGLVRISLAAAESAGLVSGNGRTIVFDLTLGGWLSVDDQRGQGASEATQSAAMAYVGGYWRYSWMGVDGFVYYEKLSTDGTAYLDASSWVTAQYELPRWKLGLQQDQRIYEMMLLFEQHSAAGITVEVANDYGAYAGGDSKVWAEAATLSQRHLSYRPRPHGLAVGLRVKDTAPVTVGTGRGFTFIGISADIAPKQGPTRGTPRLAVAGRR